MSAGMQETPERTMQAASIHPIVRRMLAAAVAVTLALGATLVSPLAVPSYQAAHATVISVTIRQRLSNYGGWRTSSRFGEVWVPSVQSEWRPYTEGRWVWTDEGWYWESAEPFGDIVYHYGRWAYDPEFGWVWVVGYEWAPSWVVWREGDDDIGWAPAPPRGGAEVFEEDWWCFAPVAAIGAADLVTVVRPVRDNVTIIRNTTIINQTVVVNNAPRVRLGNQVVAINAGPRLQQLPKTVVTTIKAAKVVPPRKGVLAEARLDPSQGEAVKMLAGNPAPATQGVAPAIANMPVVVGPGPKKLPGVNTISPAGSTAEGASNPNDKKRMGVIAGNGVETLQAHKVRGGKRVYVQSGPREVLSQERFAHAPRNHQQMMVMHTPHRGPEKIAPRHPPMAVQAGKALKCDPRIQHCKPPG